MGDRHPVEVARELREVERQPTDAKFVELRRRDVRTGGIPFRVPGAGVIPWLALVVIVAFLTKLQLDEWIAVSSLAALAAVFYFAARSRRTSPVADPAGD